MWVFSTDAYSKLCEEATTRLNEFYAQPMQPSVSKFRAASDIDCSDYEELYRSANLFQTWLVGFCNWLVNEVRSMHSSRGLIILKVNLTSYTTTTYWFFLGVLIFL